MALPAFDTLKVANRLKAVGVPPAQAEAEAEVFSEIFEVNLRELATKEDLQREIGNLRKDMDAKFAGIDAKFESVDAKFESVDAKLTAMEERLNAKHESLRKDIAAMEERFDSRFDKLLLQLTFRLSGVMVATLTALSLLPRIFH